jgi:hypothetical protein
MLRGMTPVTDEKSITVAPLWKAATVAGVIVSITVAWTETEEIKRSAIAHTMRFIFHLVEVVDY